MESIIRSMRENDIVQYGDFTLKSGQKSNIYVNLKNIPSYPKLFQDICYMIEENLDDSEFDYICGVPYGAIPFASYLAVNMGIPLLIMRKEEKKYGAKKQIDGVFQKGGRVLLLEDVVTTGGSIDDAKKVLEEHGLSVTSVFTILNRGDLDISSLLTMEDLKPSKEENVRETIKRKSKICVAGDVSTVQELYELIHKVGKYICILKTHIDTLSGWNKNVPNELNKLKNEYDFLIWEDRKFADIAHIVSKQVHGGIYKISSWADIVSVHMITGVDIIEACNPCMVVGIMNMSSKGWVSYGDEAEVFTNCIKKNIMGVVTQKELEYYEYGDSGDSKYINSEDSNIILPLNIVPGIKLERGTDEKNQVYNTIEDKKWADVFVVGRGITQSEDPEKEIQKYIEQCNE